MPPAARSPCVSSIDRQRLERRRARLGPAAGGEEGEDAIERGVDALGDGARRGERGQGVVDGVRAVEGEARGEVRIGDLAVVVVGDDRARGR